MPGQVNAPPMANAGGTAGVACRPTPFKPGEDLPNPLPPGAHRVISEMTAAQMRKMMEGVVLFGTGKPAQLNGYSSGGKTGTAQKIDPVTHLYSKTMHIASFAGIAPVNNPVIAVAVVIDNPKGASYYGTAVSAPVFAEVAQQVLEYLGVPARHRRPAAARRRQRRSAVKEDDAGAIRTTSTRSSPRSTICRADDPLRAAPASAAECGPILCRRRAANKARRAPKRALRAITHLPASTQAATVVANLACAGHHQRRKKADRPIAHRIAGAQGD